MVQAPATAVVTTTAVARIVMVPQRFDDRPRGRLRQTVERWATDVQVDASGIR
jgi:hypothetical protein